MRNPLRKNTRRNNSSVLSIVAIAVIVGALVIWNRTSVAPEPTPEQQPIVYSVSEAPAVDQHNLESDTTSESPAASQTVPPAENESVSAATTVENWLLPGNGEWTSAYGFRLDPTLNDYRFHNGTDMELPEGALVFAVADGVISKIYTDDQWGASIEMSHAGGMTSIYHGVRASQVAEGDQMNAGDTIGVVTASPPAEAMQKPHLHLELINADGLCDPQQYIK